jgi:hypothetical protein
MSRGKASPNSPTNVAASAAEPSRAGTELEIQVKD